MTAEAPALVRSWPVGSRTATLTVPRPAPGSVLSAVIEWSPDAPRGLSGAEWKQYRDGRNAALAEVAAELGVSAAVLDV